MEYRNFVNGGAEDWSGGNENLEGPYFEHLRYNINGAGADGAASSTGRRWYRHTPAQIQELEEFYKNNPHPNETQRQELSNRLALEPKQVMFWFQNKRNQMKTQAERHESVLLKQDNERLMAANKSLEDALENLSCNQCADTVKMCQLRINHSTLKNNLERLKGVVAAEQLPGLSPDMLRSIQISNQTEASMFFELANVAMGELIKKTDVSSPLWIKNMDEGREVFDHGEYFRTYTGCTGLTPDNYVYEATREVAMVNIDCLSLVETMMDANRWAAMFANMISTASTTNVISPGTNGSRNGALQVMYAELQIVSPLVPARKINFLRHCKSYEGIWVIVDMSTDNIQDAPNKHPNYHCRRLPSGCIVTAMSNGSSRITWVDHSEYDENAVPTIYRQVVQWGVGYGAKRWLATLQRKCNYPSDIRPISAGKKNMLNLTERMVNNFCAGICWSSARNWEILQVENLGAEIKLMTRTSTGDSGEPSGVIISAATSVWMPVSMHRLHVFLLDGKARCAWDNTLFADVPMPVLERIVKGNLHHGNVVTIFDARASRMNNRSMLLLQETSIDASGSMIVYAPVDGAFVNAVMNGENSTNVPLLPSGFAIVPDGTLFQGSEGGCLLTVGFQILVSSLAASPLTLEFVENVKEMLSSTIQKISVGLGMEVVA